MLSQKITRSVSIIYLPDTVASIFFYQTLGMVEISTFPQMFNSSCRRPMCIIQTSFFKTVGRGHQAVLVTQGNTAVNRSLLPWVRYVLPIILFDSKCTMEPQELGYSHSILYQTSPYNALICILIPATILQMLLAKATLKWGTVQATVSLWKPLRLP